LLTVFSYVGLVSFGGGYAMIPLIEYESVRHGWMTAQEFTDAVALAGMAPGPIALNSAVYVGFRTAGLSGALAAATGMIWPSFILVVAAALFFYKVKHNIYMKYLFYGLRPVIAGLILYSAFRFADSNGMLGPWDRYSLGLACIFAAALILLLRFRIHPLWIIGGSGIAGMLLYA